MTALIPAFNAAATLAMTLDSVAAQSRFPDDVIVVDDGSTDETARIAMAHPVGARVIRQANAGAAAAMNHGLRFVEGGVVAFLDADDLWTTDWLATVENVFAAAPADILFGHLENFLCPSVTAEQANRLTFARGMVPGYLPGACTVRAGLFSRIGAFDPLLRTGYFIEWMARARASGIAERVLPRLALRRRIRSGSAGARPSRGGDGLSADFLEIARRAIAMKRGNAR